MSRPDRRDGTSVPLNTGMPGGRYQADHPAFLLTLVETAQPQLQPLVLPHPSQT
jgi:hypothetical protein